MTCQGCGTVFIPTNDLLRHHAACIWNFKPGTNYTVGVDPAAGADYSAGYYREMEQEQARQARWKQEQFDEARRQNEEHDRKRRETWENFNSRFWSGSKSHTAKPEEEMVDLTLARVKKLLLLCHPDKHGNSEVSGEITRWLIDLKKRLEGG